MTDFNDYFTHMIIKMQKEAFDNPEKSRYAKQNNSRFMSMESFIKNIRREGGTLTMLILYAFFYFFYYLITGER